MAGAPEGDAQEDDPYSILGVNPLKGFEAAKTAYKRKSKEAEAAGNMEELERLERAYDMLMMRQLSLRKQGVTFGSFEVSKEIKYADSEDIFPWRPRWAKSGQKDILINAAASVFMAAWIASAQAADYKPLQFLIFFSIFRLFMKLDAYIPSLPEDEEKKWKRNGRRLRRALTLTFGTVLAASLSLTLLIKATNMLGLFVPRAFFSLQELIITVITSIGLFVIGSYYS